MDHINSSLKNLSSDLVLEILLRLPVKSLNQCCCVCKSWKTLIRSDSFIKLHLKQSLQCSLVNFNKVIISAEAEFRKNRMWDISLLPFYFFGGCCNGLLCYYSKSKISNSVMVHLWNPATKCFRSLPQGFYNYAQNKKILVFFSYDSMNDDYLVVKLFFWRNQNFINFNGEVYSLKTNFWKAINLSSWSIRVWIGSNIVLHDGALHCITASFPTAKIVLGTFNIAEETYVECALPCTNFKKKPMANLGSSSQFLSLSFWREEFEIWTMKEYGVWTKLFALANSPLVYSPFGITETGKLLAVNWNGEDVVYDPEKQVIEKYVHNKVIFLKENVDHSMPPTDHVRIAEYVESMISVYPSSPETSEGNALADFTSM